jgi:hypothetical protein
MRRVLVGYLCATSVLLHILVVVGGILFLRMGKQMAATMKPDKTISGEILAVSRYELDGLAHLGYAVKWTDGTLYLSGAHGESLNVGDHVDLLVQKQDFLTMRYLNLIPRKAAASTCQPQTLRDAESSRVEVPLR